MKPSASVAALALVLAAAALAKEPDLGQAAQAIVAGTNALRREHGLERVEVVPRLVETARDFAIFMAQTDRFDHTADGRHPEDRAKSHGYDYCLVAENIGYEFRSVGFDTGELARALVDGWRNSPPHRKNMLDGNATEIGVAIARSPRTGRYYGVQMFGRPRSASVEFSVANQARRTIAYRLGEREFTLEPRVIRTHRECGETELVVELPGERPSKVPVKNRDRFAVVDDRGRLALRRAPHRLRRRELPQDRVVEGREVVGLAAGHDLAVDDDFLVGPLGSGVAQVLLQARPARHELALREPRVDQRPRAVADRGDGLPLAAEFADQRDRFLAQPQVIRVRHAARQHERIEIGGQRVAHVHLDREAVAVLEMVEGLDLLALVLGRDERDLRAVLLEEIARLRVLHFLDTVGHQHRDALALQLRPASCRHDQVSWNVRALYKGDRAGEVELPAMVRSSHQPSRWDAVTQCVGPERGGTG
jgi:uncharacterized protein YkwD